MKDFMVLVVDDEKDFLETTTKRMRKHEIRCESAESGEEAIEKIKKGDIDVVLLDVKMPGMGGVETLREIKRIKPLIEVVMLTGHASVESGIEGMKLGAFDYLMKPMEFDKLVEKLNDAYEKKAIQEEKIEKAQFTQNLTFHRGQK
ncbi:MAG: response regulator [Desulfobulbaceae bacterium]|nr:response regulator [Desulfobulbaceae bacterium]